MTKEAKIKQVDELLSDFRNDNQPYNQNIISFTDVQNKDVYNITAPFLDNGEWIIAGRVEERDSEYSKVSFFSENNGKWIPRKDLPTFELQDPFVCTINGQLIFGGVEVFEHPENKGNLWWQTKFYRGKDIKSLKPFAVGPRGMKDIRLVELADGRIGVFTRPQGEFGGRGKIGFTTICTLDDLNETVIINAPLLDQFVDEEWGGANEAHVLRNGKIGVLGHIAKFSQDDYRHYYPMIFVLDPETNSYSSIKIIAERKNFQEGPAKRPDLYDVLFSGGLVRNDDGTARLYVGISDAQAGYITIDDPFRKYEN